MKNILLFFFSFLLGIGSVFAQPYNFVGEIHYKIEYTTPEGVSPHYVASLPKSMHVYVRKNLVCSQGPVALKNGYLIKIINLEKNQGYLGIKYSKGSIYKAIEPHEIQNDYNALNKPVDIEYVNETKSFGGFVGKKALVFLDNESDPLTVYYTTEITAKAFPIFQDLIGFPLYYEGTKNGVPFKAYATTVNPREQPNERFIMPSEYQRLSKEEFKAYMLTN